MFKSIQIVLNGISLAIQFLTTIPLKRQVDWNEKNAAASLGAFPFIGLLLGFILSVIYLLSYNHLPNFVLVFLLFFLSVVYSGALHLDGYMDVSDAVLSHRDREKKLAIMKDPQVGPFAVISLLFLVGWRLVFMYETMQWTTTFSFIVLMIPFLSRWIMGWMLLFGKPARNEGLAYMYQPYRTKTVKIVYILWLLVMIISCLYFLPQFVITLFVLLIATIFFYVISLKFFYEQFGGVTGDTIGATGEGGETFLWMIMFLLHYFVMGAL